MLPASRQEVQNMRKRALARGACPAEPSLKREQGSLLTGTGKDRASAVIQPANDLQMPLTITQSISSTGSGPSLWTAVVWSLSQLLNGLPCGNGFSADTAHYYGNHSAACHHINYSTPHNLFSKGSCPEATQEWPFRDFRARFKIALLGRLKGSVFCWHPLSPASLSQSSPLVCQFLPSLQQPALYPHAWS